MVVEIRYTIPDKHGNYKVIITIDEGVDYAYFKALFDALLEKGIEFHLTLPPTGDRV